MLSFGADAEYNSVAAMILTMDVRGIQSVAPVYDVANAAYEIWQQPAKSPQHIRFGEPNGG